MADAPTTTPVCPSCGTDEQLVYDFIDEPTPQRSGTAIFHCLACGGSSRARIDYGWRQRPATGD